MPETHANGGSFFPKKERIMADSSNRGGDWADAPAPMRSERTSPAPEASAFQFDRREEGESIPDLLRTLVHQGSRLAEQQSRLVRAEVRSAVGDLTASAGAMAGAAVLGIAGLGVVLMGLSFLVAQVMPVWLATLIVGVAALLGAYAMFAAGKKKIESSSLSMERTRHTIERAPTAMSGNANEVSRGR
jgi:hypothetical protein